MTKSVIVVNTTIMNSIPIDKGLKRYFINWFQRMCRCNGNNFAVEKAKILRELLMEYISDLRRLEEVETYMSRAPIRKNRRLRQLFSYADTNPHAVLAFLKFYLGDAEPQVTVEESQHQMHELLQSISKEPEVPTEVIEWLRLLRSSISFKKKRYWIAKRDPSDLYHRVVSHFTLDEWLRYWSTWRSRLLYSSFREHRRPHPLAEAVERVPVPSMYSDYDPRTNTSDQFEVDANEFLGFFPDMRGGEETLPLHLLDWLLVNDEPDRVFNVFELDDIVGDLDPDEWWVGQIHHIPKKGTVKRRPIAVPNRFLQRGLAPYAEYLYRILKALPRDHTFDQTKSKWYVQHRLDNNHYTCSVDLSHATDYLPKVIGDYIVDQLSPSEPNEDIWLSRELFDFMSRAPWKNGEYLDCWKVGQPLGTLPSFGLLALEHNVLLESLALACGYIHSPYTVLGDDVLLFSKRMRRAYIRMMNSLGVPLSLHKSYEHRLVEFAGQVLIKRQSPRYTPDPNRVNMYNLFDYSRNTGFLLSWRELPPSIRKFLSRQAAKASLRGHTFYRLAAELYFATYGSPYDAYMDLTMDVLPQYIRIVESQERIIPDQSTTSGWTILTLLGEERLTYTGRGLNRSASTPAWIREKFKPASTTQIIANALQAVRESRHIME